MNSLLRCCIVAAVVLGASACASPGSSGYASPAPRLVPANYERDHEHITVVERAARRHGLEVYWISPPLKRVTVAPDENGAD